MATRRNYKLFKDLCDQCNCVRWIQVYFRSYTSLKRVCLTTYLLSRLLYLTGKSHLYHLIIHLKNSTLWYQTKNKDHNDGDDDDKRYYIPEVVLHVFHVCFLMGFSKQPYKVGTIITITQMMKGRLRKVVTYPQSHTQYVVAKQEPKAKTVKMKGLDM